MPNPKKNRADKKRFSLYVNLKVAISVKVILFVRLIIKLTPSKTKNDPT